MFVSVEPTILHADLDAFYASVEQRDTPRLRGRPVLVGGGVVLACSYEAKARGVHTPIGARAALALCPDAVVVTPRMTAYAEASRAVFEIFRDTAPTVEALSIDEAFLDVRGLERISGTPSEIALVLRRRVREQVGLPITVGVARSKFLAKVASAVAKPDGLLVVPLGGELDFLHPLAVERLWGVGRVTAAKLHAYGIHTVGQLAAEDEAALVTIAGRATGRHIHALARGHDPRPVKTRARRRSIGAQRALGRRPRPRQEIAVSLIALVDRVTRRLRAAERVCRTVTLRLRFGDYTRATRSRTLSDPTDHTPTILAAALELLRAAGELIDARGLTLVGIALGNLTERGAVQLELPLDKARQLDSTLDRVRNRYGAAAITRGSLVGRDPGFTVPLLPD
jgi:DNA polymerase-4